MYLICTARIGYSAQIPKIIRKFGNEHLTIRKKYDKLKPLFMKGGGNMFVYIFNSFNGKSVFIRREPLFACLEIK